MPFHPKHLNLKLDNPPRRDVALLPRNGFLVLAFRADNPGTWLMHCHIVGHAARGLALQILERRHEAERIFQKSGSAGVAKGICARWKKWVGDCNNWWPGDGSGCLREKIEGPFAFQDDSGI